VTQDEHEEHAMIREDATQTIAAFVADQDLDAIAPEVLERGRINILDGFAAGLAGVRSDIVTRTAQVLAVPDPDGAARLWGTNDRCSPAEAALVNAARMHAFDFDAVHDVAIVHAYTTALPAAMALGDARSASGSDILGASLIGAEVGIRLGLAIGDYRGFILTAICGTFSAAAAAARVLGLDAARTANALGIAYSMAAGNRQAFLDGSDTTRLQPGFQARAGVVAGLLAEAGLTGARFPIEGRAGFLTVYCESGNPRYDLLLDDLGKRFHAAEISLKPFPACRGTHGPIQAAVMATGGTAIDPERIRAVRIHAAANVTGLFRNLSTPFKPGRYAHVDAQYSIRYTVAAAIATGRMGLMELEQDVILSPSILRLAERVEVIDDLEAPHAKALDPVDLVIEMEDGTTMSAEVRGLWGDPSFPWAWPEVGEKLAQAVTFGLGGPSTVQAEALARAVSTIRDLDDINRLPLPTPQ
jgi:2-methylcitrate dehydratase PrpD